MLHVRGRCNLATWPRLQLPPFILLCARMLRIITSNDKRVRGTEQNAASCVEHAKEGDGKRRHYEIKTKA